MRLRADSRFRAEQFPLCQFMAVRIEYPCEEIPAAYDTNRKFIRRLLDNPTYSERFKGKAGPTYYFMLTQDALCTEGVFQAAESASIPRSRIHIDTAEVIPANELPHGLLEPNTFVVDFASHSWF